MYIGGALQGILFPWNLGRLGNSVSLWLNIEPYELFFYVFLPPLLLDAAVKLDFFLFKKVQLHHTNHLTHHCTASSWQVTTFSWLFAGGSALHCARISGGCRKLCAADTCHAVHLSASYTRLAVAPCSPVWLNACQHRCCSHCCHHEDRQVFPMSRSCFDSQRHYACHCPGSVLHK